MTVFCVNCGGKLPEGASFCPVCGTKALVVSENISKLIENAETPLTNANENEPQQQEPVAEQPSVAQTEPQPATVAAVSIPGPSLLHMQFGKAFKSGSFLALCILVTVAAAASLVIGSLDILLTLFTVAFWCLRSAATEERVLGYSFPLKMVSVLTFIQYILNWVASGLVALGALIMGAFGAASFVINIPLLYGEVIDEIRDEFYHEFGSVSEYGLEVPFKVEQIFDQVLNFLFDGGFFILSVIFLIIAVLIAIVNIYCYKNIDRCAKSFKNSYFSNCLLIERVETVSTWLIVLAVLNGLSALGSFDNILTFAVTASSTATAIVASIWLKKYFGK